MADALAALGPRASQRAHVLREADAVLEQDSIVLRQRHHGNGDLERPGHLSTYWAERLLGNRSRRPGSNLVTATSIISIARPRAYRASVAGA